MNGKGAVEKKVTKLGVDRNPSVFTELHPSEGAAKKAAAAGEKDAKAGHHQKVKGHTMSV